MTSTWVLIIFLRTQSYAIDGTDPLSITLDHIDGFSSAAACQQAAASLKNQFAKISHIGDESFICLERR